MPHPPLPGARAGRSKGAGRVRTGAPRPGLRRGRDRRPAPDLPQERGHRRVPDRPREPDRPLVRGRLPERDLQQARDLRREPGLHLERDPTIPRQAGPMPSPNPVTRQGLPFSRVTVDHQGMVSVPPIWASRVPVLPERGQDIVLVHGLRDIDLHIHVRRIGDLRITDRLIIGRRTTTGVITIIIRRGGGSLPRHWWHRPWFS